MPKLPWKPNATIERVEESVGLQHIEMHRLVVKCHDVQLTINNNHDNTKYAISVSVSVNRQHSKWCIIAAIKTTWVK